MRRRKELLEAEQKVYQLKELARSFNEKESSFQTTLHAHFDILKKAALLEAYMKEDDRKKGAYLIRKFNEIVYGQAKPDWNILYRTMNVTADEKVRVFQRKLCQKAKQDKSFKAYSLYDKVCQEHVLQEAYRRVKAGKQEYDGGGVEGVTFGMIEKDGLAQFLESIQEELRNKIYRPQAIRRVMIPKAGSKEKLPLGISKQWKQYKE